MASKHFNCEIVLQHLPENKSLAKINKRANLTSENTNKKLKQKTDPEKQKEVQD